MIQVKAINGISLTVRDLDASLKWYREKLGFEKLYDDTPNSDGVTIGKNGVELLLQPLAKPETATPVDTVHQICIPLLTFEVAADELAKVEQVFSEDTDIVKLNDHPKYRSRIVEDPDGHAIEFYSTKG